MSDNIIFGSLPILIAELIVLVFAFFYINKSLIPKYFANVDKKAELENIKKANRSLYILTFLSLVYIFLEYLGFEAYILHIVLTFLIAMFAKSILHPFTLSRWGKESFDFDDVDDNSLELISELEKLLAKSKNNKVEYSGYEYVKRADVFKKKIPKKNKETSKSKFWEGFLVLIVWAFFLLNIIYVMNVDLGAPEILITLVAFVVAYVFSPFYPDLYSTYLIAQDDNIHFDDFIEVEVGGKKYFGSVEKLTFFKVTLRDWYSDTFVTFFHKLFLGGVVTSFPNGRYIEYDYVVTKDDRVKLKESIPKWIKNECKEDVLGIPILSNFPHNYGYGLKLRVKVKPDFLKKYGRIRDDLINLISDKSDEVKIDLRTFNGHVVQFEESKKGSIYEKVTNK